MKIAAKAIEAYVGRPDPTHRATLLYGPDNGLIRERAKKLASWFVNGSDDPFARVELTEAQILSDHALLSDEISAISMMAPKRAIIIRDAGDKLTRIIEGASAAFNDGAFLIVCGDELSSRSSLRAWFEKTNLGAALACYHDEARDVHAVIRKHFETAQVQADRDAIDYLAAQLGNDRYVTYQELDKLCTYAAESKRITLEDAQALVDYNRETSFDEVVNAVADRNLQALEKTLTMLLREGTQPVAYLRALQRYFNKLYVLRAQMAQGRSADQVIAGLRPPVFFKQVPILTRHVQSWTTEQLVKALKLLVSAELACKTSDLPIVPASGRKLLQVTQVR